MKRMLRHVDSLLRGASVGYPLAALSVMSAVVGLLWGWFSRLHHPRCHRPSSRCRLSSAALTADDLAPAKQQRETSTSVNTMSNLD